MPTAAAAEVALMCAVSKRFFSVRDGGVDEKKGSRDSRARRVVRRSALAFATRKTVASQDVDEKKKKPNPFRDSGSCESV